MVAKPVEPRGATGFLCPVRWPLRTDPLHRQAEMPAVLRQLRRDEPDAPGERGCGGIPWICCCSSARLVLAAVFGVAGLTKLFDRRNVVQSVAEFGVPKALVTPFAPGTGADGAHQWPLRSSRSQQPGGVRSPPLVCWSCFSLPWASTWRGAGGQPVAASGRSGPARLAGRRSLRNLVLAALAGLVAWQGPTASDLSAVAWIRGVSAMEGLGLGLGAAAVIMLVAEAWLLLEFWKLCGRLLLRIEALESSLAAGTAAAAPDRCAERA